MKTNPFATLARILWVLWTAIVCIQAADVSTYTATLSFAKVAFDPISYSDVPGVSVYASSTTCKLRTLSTPSLTIEQTAANDAQLSFNSDTGRSYDIRASADLTNWTSLLITNAAGTNVIYQDAISPALTNRFYRLQSP